MVRLKGPGLAAEAAGSLGRSLIFSKCKGRAYAKKWASPHNPDTEPQRAMRALTKFLLWRWGDLSDADKATWLQLAEPQELPPYNAFLAHNLARWRNWLAPTDAYPATMTGTTGLYTYWSAVAASRGVDFSIAQYQRNDTRGYLLFRSLTPGLTPAWNNLRHVFPSHHNGYLCWFDRPIPPGTYYYRLAKTTRFGKMEAATSEKSVTVT